MTLTPERLQRIAESAHEPWLCHGETHAMACELIEARASIASLKAEVDRLAGERLASANEADALRRELDRLREKGWRDGGEDERVSQD
jgi:hypothetical protein